MTETQARESNWYLVSDPLPPDEGGLAPGAAFNPIDFATTLQMGNWTPGAVFRLNRKRYKVTDHRTVADSDGIEHYFSSATKRIEPVPAAKPQPKPKKSTGYGGLTEAQQAEIRRRNLAGTSQVRLAREYNVTEKVIRNILRGTPNG